MDEAVQGVETPVEQPATDNTPVESGLGEPTLVQPAQGTEEATTAPQNEAPKEDNRDFKAYSHKLEAENKDIRAMYQEAIKNAPQVAPQATAIPADEEQALNLLKQVISDTVNPIIAPIVENKVWDDFEKRDLVGSLKPEIAQELAKLPNSMPLADRLDAAYAKAIVNNLPKLREAFQSVGAEQAYNNQAGKRAAASGIGASPSKAGVTQDSVVDRVMRGESVSTEEYRENRAEIQKAQREAIIGG